MWVSLTNPLPGEVYCQWYLQFTTHWAWWLHLVFRVRSWFRNCVDGSWVGTTRSPMKLCWGGSSGYRAYHIWKKVAIPRCYQPEGFGDLASVELHQFANASELGYGCVSFLKLKNQVGEVHCTFTLDKSRVAPLKQMTIPRMELAAAVVAVKVAFQLQTELDFPLENTHFWSDSYIRNEEARYNTFVANRVALIREYSSPSQWNYVPTHQNLADDASRGLDGDALLECESWRNGPEFLWKSQSEWPPQPDSYSIDDTDAEVKQVSCGATASHQDSIFFRFMTYFSDWFKLRRIVALLHRAVLGWKYSVSGDQKGVDPRSVPLNASDIKAAEMVVLRWSQ